MLFYFILAFCSIARGFSDSYFFNFFGFSDFFVQLLVAEEEAAVVVAEVEKVAKWVEKVTNVL